MTDSPWTFHEPPTARYRHYRYNGETKTPEGLEILSVTQALGTLDKSAPLSGYAARETLRGVSALLYRATPDVAELVRWAADPPIMSEAGDWSKGRIGELLKRERLTFRDRTSDAQDRGTAVHKALENWIDERRIPNPADYRIQWRGYFRALAAWLSRDRPEFLESELIVGSRKHGYAGKRDTVARVRDPKRGLALLDAKTSKAVYPSSMFRQLVAYDEGGIECGEAPTDSQGIVRLGSDGSWEIQWLQDFSLPRGWWRDAFLRALATCRDEREIAKAERPHDEFVLRAAGFFPLKGGRRWGRRDNETFQSFWKSEALRLAKAA